MVNVDEKWIGLTMEETNCWQFIVDYYNNELGISLLPFKGSLQYKNQSEKLAVFLDEYLNNSGHWEKISNPIYPDIAMFKVRRLIIHGAIILDDERILHMRYSGSLISSYKDGNFWREKKFRSLEGFYRYKKGSNK